MFSEALNMRLISYRQPPGPLAPAIHGWGVLDGDDIIPLADTWPTLREGLASGNDAIADRVARSGAERISSATVRLLTPGTAPGKILCMRIKYGPLAAEAGRHTTGCAQVRIQVTNEHYHSRRR